MLPLHEDSHFTFRFADDRIIPRFHLESVEAGRRVSVFKIDPGTGERLGLLATASVGEGGWVDLPEPIVVTAGEAFIAVPEPVSLKCETRKVLVNTLGAAGLLAIVGYFCGLVQGGGNQFLLAVCGGALGAFIVLLGYGPIAVMIGALGAVAEWFHRRKNGSIRK